MRRCSYWSIFIGCLLSVIANGQSNFIYTYAGSVAGFGGDGGLAAAALLNGPSGVDIDRWGNIFIVDAGNLRIRRISASSIVSTYAGGSQSGYSGDGGLAINAGFGNVRGICVDQNGDVYFADYTFSTIRKIDAGTGIITKIAGNPSSWGYSGDGGFGNNALLYRPTAVFVDTIRGNLYVSDTYNHRIRIINLQTGIINTVAGNGQSGYSGDGGLAIAARLQYPVSVVVDDAGNVYIGDYGNHVIRKVDTTGLITTIAGTGTLGYSGDGGPAISALLSSPCGLALWSDTILYFTDRNNNRIRCVNLITGIIDLIAGNGVFGFGGDGGPAVMGSLANPNDLAITSNGDLLIADDWNHRIRKIAIQVGYELIFESGDFRFYPNPGTDYLHVSFPKNGRKHELILFDFSGKVVNSYISENSDLIICIRNLPSGIYMLEVLTDEEKSPRAKLIVMH